MTDRAQFEAMLEALINEDHEQAKEIFHNIVVGKSREIYEELLAEDFDAKTANEAANNMPNQEEEESVGDDDKETDDSEDDDSGEFDGEDDDSEDDDSEEEEPGEFGDIEGDIEDAEDDADAIEGDDADMEDRVMDLEDALEDLKAEFEQLLQGEEHEEENEPGIHGDGMPMHDLAGEMGMDGGAEHDPEPMMEYYKKVSVTHGDNGKNTKSIVAGKNDMGGTTANIAKNFSTTSGGTEGGLAKPSAGDLTKGMNVHNRVQSNAGKTAFKKQEPGHGPEKAGKKESNVDKKSLIGGKIR